MSPDAWRSLPVCDARFGVDLVDLQKSEREFWPYPSREVAGQQMPDLGGHGNRRSRRRARKGLAHKPRTEVLDDAPNAEASEPAGGDALEALGVCWSHSLKVPAAALKPWSESSARKALNYLPGYSHSHPLVTAPAPS